MLDIIERFNALSREEKAHRDDLDRRIEQREAQLKRLQKRRDNAPYTGWIEGVVEPLAIELGKATSLAADIYGPFGLAADTSIYLMEEIKKGITKQPTLGITLEPHFRDGDLEIRYRTGETTSEYGPNTIGYINGLNCVTAPLPDTITEIVGLLKRAGGEPE